MTMDYSQSVPLGSVTEMQVGFAFKGEKFVDHGRYRLLRGSNVKRSRLDWSDDITRWWSEIDDKLKRYALRPGDIVIAMDGALVGRSFAQIKEEDIPSLLVQRVARLRCSNKSDGNYVYQLIQSPFFSRRMDSVRTHTAIPHISAKDISDFNVFWPPPASRARIGEVLTKLDRAIELADKLIAAKQKHKHAVMQRVHVSHSKDLHERKLGELFKHRKKKGTDGLPTFSVTIDNGLVLRNSLDRKNDTSLRPDEHLLIEKGDIAYNMMRMWQGASGLAPESGLVSPAYVVLRSRGEVDPLFASYWFKTPRVVKKFQDYSHGLTKDRLRLYYKDFASITLPVPPIDLQRKIAKAFAACDRELDCLQRKVAFLKLQKKGLMQQLLTGKIRVKVPKGAK